MKKTVLAVLAMAAVISSSAAFAADSAQSLGGVSITPTIGVASQGKSEISSGVELAYRKMLGVSLYSGGEKVSDRNTQFGGDLRVYPMRVVEYILGVSDLNCFVVPGLSDYGEIGMYHVANAGPTFNGFAFDPVAIRLVPTHVAGGGDYNRIAAGGGLSYSLPLPKKSTIDSVKIDLGYHTHRGIVAGLGVQW